MDPAELLNPKAYAKQQAKRVSKYVTTQTFASFDEEENLTDPGPKQTRKQPPSSAAGMNDSGVKYDPKALLAPRGNAVSTDSPIKGRNQSDHGGLSREDAASDTIGGEEAPGMSTFLEKQHGLTNREFSRNSKRKPDDTEEHEDPKKLKSTFAGASNGGPIGEYVKEERKRANADLPPPDTVDLTNDGDDDDLMIIHDSRTEEVCLGMIKVDVNAHRVPELMAPATSSAMKMWPRARVTLHREPAQDHVISVRDRKNIKFGSLEFRAANALCPLLDGSRVNKLRITSHLDARKRRDDQIPSQPCSELLKMACTLYAPKNRVKAIGRSLSQKQIFLSHPLLPEAGKEICNPHIPTNFAPPKGTPFSSLRSLRANGPGNGLVNRTQEEVRQEAKTMFDKLAKDEDIPEKDLSGQGQIITTALMHHQKQALHFLLEHERGDLESDQSGPKLSLWKPLSKPNGQEVFYNVITGHEQSEKPKSLRGGILADMMGLGKTLSIMALIAETRNQAMAFSHAERQPEDPIEVQRCARATLIVCPKSVLSNWLEQVKLHTAENQLRVYAYHGSARSQDLDLLAESDIVLTSYNIVAAEFCASDASRKRAITSIKWFRIVLDEAHQIRTQSTNGSKACCHLAAQRRWAVTGTPIQNRLEDLGALVKFLRIQPFDNDKVWAQYIIAPFKTANEDIVQQLQLLVSSITLRRMRDKVNIVDRHESVHYLEFSADEKIIYDEFAREGGRQLRQMTSNNGQLRGRAYAHILKSISRLRNICAHGREMLNEEDLLDLEGLTSSTAIELYDEPESGSQPFISERQAYEMLDNFVQSDLDLCARCLGKLVQRDQELAETSVVETSDEDSDTSEADGENDDTDVESNPRSVDKHRKHDHLGILTQGCLHLICSQCEHAHTKAIKPLLTADSYYTCPICEQYVRHAEFQLSRSGMEKHTGERNVPRKKGKSTKCGSRATYAGPHTKVKALLAALERNHMESAALPEGEGPIRSVVFSGWTTYLDLIEFALEDNGIAFTRLDGSMSVKQRSEVLDRFKSDPSITVLLVSIKAGGQGLNFTAANKVYMMEPQFNPGVEQQAIDRVHRLGQKRKVEIVHYVMKDSIEGKILDLQAKKQKLAALSLERKSSKAEEAKKRIEELRSLFK